MLMWLRKLSGSKQNLGHLYIGGCYPQLKELKLHSYQKCFLPKRATITDRSTWVFDKEKKKWVQIDFLNLKDGDIFKIMDGKERYINEETGDSVWIAKGEVYINLFGLPSIHTLY